ncbi:amine oxidase catalytic domain-containing protein [Ephemerocybe angulata]|uniref:Amine oxidase n=1 Tax=Ephemerocybe angulata TaxID=980116 RepID=A0A8H6HSD4_9AGAR|nr:amine oxidase catalytic domain-containing protein [Tulosesus angulatus]
MAQRRSLPTHSSPTSKSSFRDADSPDQPLISGHCGGEHGQPKRQQWRFSSFLIVAAAATLGIIVGSHIPRQTTSFGAGIGLDELLTPEVVVQEELRRCPSNLPLPASPPAKVNPWAQLSIPEVLEVQEWLMDPKQNLNLTDAVTATPSDNAIFLIEAYHPLKSEVLEYFAASANDMEAAKAPEKYARVTIDHGGLKEPVTRDYVVGPLPTSKQTTMRRLTDIYHRPEIPFNARGSSTFTALEEALAKAVAPMSEAVEGLFGATPTGKALNDTYIAGVYGPWSYDGSFRRGWISWRYNTPGSWLLPIDFYQYFDWSGSDTEQWRILKVVYHNQTFSSVDAFISAYRDGTIIRFPSPSLPTPQNGTSSTWTQRGRANRSKPRDLDHLPGPRSVSFAGLRFRVDRNQNYVSWMGWGVYIGFDRDMGLALWDIRFKGERIAYQLAPQDTFVQYAGNDPMQSLTSWLDRYYGMGFLTRDLIPNYDCPQEAVYLPSTTFHAVLGTITRKRAICVFEQDVGRPLTRHFGGWQGETGAVKGYVLTIRTIATVGNYDYSFDYIFQLDGTIEVKLSASGYLQGGYWTPDRNPYGARIGDFSMGSVHDHVINFKVDLDIAGLNNSFLKTTSVVETIYPEWLDDPDWPSDTKRDSQTDDHRSKARLVQRLKREYIETESSKDSRVRYSQNHRSSYAVVNRDALNAWGAPRGYAIHPGLSQVHNTIVKAVRTEKNANWANHNLAVTLRKDTEPSSSSMWNLNLPGDPPVNFDKFFDGDNITQKDLVLWINVGTHHWPGSEDSPNTKTNTASSSFMLTPLNYFDSDPSMESMNAITLDLDPDSPEEYLFDDNGVQQHHHCMPEAPSVFKYERQVSAPDLKGMDTEEVMERVLTPMYIRFRS